MSIKSPDTLISAGLLLIVASAFEPALGCDFVNLDDPLYVTQNQDVLTGLTAANVRWALTAADGGNWHPLTWWSLQLDASLFGPGPRGFHFTNVLLHALSVVSLYFLIVALIGSRWPSAIIAGLFAVHPLRAESVAWIAERKDTLYVLFYIWTLAAYVHYTRSPRLRRGLVVLLVFALGLMSKSMLVTAPCLMVVLDYWPLRRRGDASLPHGAHASTARPVAQMSAATQRTPGSDLGALLREKLPMFLLAAVVSAIAIATQNQASALTQQDVLGERVLRTVLGYGMYLFQTFCPIDLCVLYREPRMSTQLLPIAVSAMILVATTAAAVWQHRRRPYFLVGWSWFLGTLVPVIGFVQIGLQPYADRYTYFPSIGLFLAIVLLLEEFVASLGSHGTKCFHIAGVAAIVVCAMLCREQVGSWRNSETLWNRVLACGQETDVADLNLGVALIDRGRVAGGVERLKRGVHQLPRNTDVQLRIARALHDHHESPAALESLKAVAMLDPENLSAQEFMAQVCGDLGRHQDAVEVFSLILNRQPMRWTARLGLAAEFIELRQYDAAERECLKVPPKFDTRGHVQFYLGLIQARRGHFTEAIKHYQSALELDPQSVRTLNNLGTVFVKLARWDEGERCFLRATESDPKYALAQFNLGSMRFQQARFQEALGPAQKAVELDPLNAGFRALLDAVSSARR